MALFLVKINCFISKPLKTAYLPLMGFFDFWKNDKSSDDRKVDVSTSLSTNQQSKPFREEIATKNRFAAPVKGVICETLGELYQVPEVLSSNNIIWCDVLIQIY
jgi:hypothetical protein